MVSLTQRTERIRRRKRTTNGTVNKRVRRALGTPVFPIHIEAAAPAVAVPTATAPAAAVPAAKKK